MRVEAAGHRAVAARGVLDQHRQRPLDPLHRLAPAVVALARVGPGGHVPAVHDQALRADRRRGFSCWLEDLPAGDPDPVVRRGDVDHVRRVDEHGHARVPERRRGSPRGSPGQHRSLPALRVAEEELDRVRARRLRRGERVAVMKMQSDEAPCAEPSPRRRQRQPAQLRPAPLLPDAAVRDRQGAADERGDQAGHDARCAGPCCSTPAARTGRRRMPPLPRTVASMCSAHDQAGGERHQAGDDRERGAERFPAVDAAGPCAVQRDWRGRGWASGGPRHGLDPRWTASGPAQRSSSTAATPCERRACCPCHSMCPAWPGREPSLLCVLDARR